MEVLSIFEDYKLAFGIFALIFGVLAALPYHWAIFEGHRPPYSTYIGWFLLGATGFVFHYQTISPDDAKWSLLLPAVFVVVPLSYLLVLIFLKAGWLLDKRDKICLKGIVISWLIWVVSLLTLPETGYLIAVPLTALVITDAFASWPILQDAFKGKESATKTKWSWALTFLSTTCGLLSVENPFSLEVVYPGYLFAMMGMIAACSLFSSSWQKLFSASALPPSSPAE
ncbi:MAG: hypothetical protein V4668_00415 [Patescibacteria group bacterium]